MELSISGFIAEEEDVDGQVGVRLTQLTDLSGIGWVPGKVLSGASADVAYFAHRHSDHDTECAGRSEISLTAQ